MYGNKARLIAMTSIIFVISIFCINKNFAKSANSEEVTDWKVAITSDAKDLKDTQEITFKVQDNPNVAKGKIAPGCKAISTITIDLEGTKVPVDILAKVNTSNLKKVFKLTAKLDGEEYCLGTTQTIELQNNSSFTRENGKKILTLELEWKNGNNEEDTKIGIMGEKIKLPVEINVTQHI